MSIFGRFQNKTVERTRIQMVTTKGNGYYAWNGRLYQSDIVRACIRPKVKAVGKLIGKHLRRSVQRDGEIKLTVNPDPFIHFLLEEPIPYMTGQKLQEKLATQLCLNNNAFALIIRDEHRYPKEIYPIPAIAAEALYDALGQLYLKFTMQNGGIYTFAYTDVIHLRQDFNNNDIFGEPIAPVLEQLMEVVSTTDQGIVKAIQNSSVIRWLLKFNTSMRPEDIDKQSKIFAENFLSVENGGYGVAGVDAKMDATQIDPKDYVPDAEQMDRTTERIYSLFYTNSKIVQSSYTEDEWTSYYEAEIEPIVLELQGEYTRKIFSRRERGFGNSIAFEAANLATASMSTKLNLCQMVDRGAMTPNEWRSVLNLAPLPGGDEVIRRLDTQAVKEVEEK